ncbi:MAG: DUF2508 family protein [Cellulosilyticaceae bacterium]
MKKRDNYDMSEALQRETDKLAEEVGYLQEEMSATLDHFSDALDPELLDYYMYYYKAAEIKHGYLLRKLKKLYYSQEGRNVI